MAETTMNSQAEPGLVRDTHEPKGVLRKNLKPLIYLGAAVLVIVAAVFSGTSKKTPSQQAAGYTARGLRQPAGYERCRRRRSGSQKPFSPANSRKRRNRLAWQMHRCPTNSGCGIQPNGAGGSLRTRPALRPAECVRTAPGGQPQVSPAQEEAQQLAAKERELAYNSRFASNLVYSHQPDAATSQQPPAGPEGASVAGYQQAPNQYMTASSPAGSSLVAPRAAGDPPPAASEQGSTKHAEVNIDFAVGQPYVIYEGLTMDTVLMNRLDGDSIGPVKVLVSNPVYSHDGQHVLIPEGTIVLGEAKKIGANGFGQQRRIAVTFHRMIMPDGYSVDLDQFHGLDQIGEEGLKDKVNNHYFQIFGTSIALGVIAGAGEITQGGGTISTSGSQAFTTGAASGVSQSATTVLDKFIQIPPTITIREGHRVKVYFTQDMLLPAYENHTIPQTY